MDVSIAAIKFNHDPDSAVNDAFTIRRNEDEDIAVPEWEMAEDGTLRTSAAAYARTQTGPLTIAVQLRRHNPTVKSVQVSSEGKGVLGNVMGQDAIVFSGRDDVSDFKLLPLIGPRLASAGVGKSQVDFQWTLRATLTDGNQTTSSDSTSHVIYTLLGAPKSPWGPDDDPRDFEPPWTEVLDLVFDWVRQATTRTEIATRITNKLYDLGRCGLLRYERNEAFSRLSYNGTDRISLTDFLINLGRLQRVNCTDCAILVSTFANILGCDLYQSEMGYRFVTNPVRVIGFPEEATELFEYHEVAWEYPCESESNLFDCCLEVDGDDEPSGGNFDSLLPVNIRFGDRTDYHFHLVQSTSDCTSSPGTRIRRKIARERMLVRLIHPRLETLLRESFDYDSWKELPSSDPLFKGPVERIGETFSFPGWRLARNKILKSEVDKMALNETIWTSTESSATVFRVLTYQTDSAFAARNSLLNLLGSFELPIIKRRRADKEDDATDLGDIAFSGPDDSVLLYSRSNLVVFIQNAGETVVPLTNFARDADAQIQRLLREGIDDESSSDQESADRQTMQASTLKTTNQQEEINSMIVNVEDRWSSNRPLRNATTPHNLLPDGIFEINSFDPATERVTGEYYDTKRHRTVNFDGSVKSNGTGSYQFEFQFIPVENTRVRRIHRGQLIIDDLISVVVGRWVEVPIPLVRDQTQSVADEAQAKSEATANGQQEGVWIATKP